jgi:hypothetical protein
MNFESINTLEIPQEATELTFNELKLICGGSGDDSDGKHCPSKKKKFDCENCKPEKDCDDDN